MDINETIIGVINLPKKFGSLGNVSIYSLLEETGYFENHSQVAECAICEALVRHPEFIYAWMRLSEDKRATGGWYFRQNNKVGYVVGYFPQNDINGGRIEYSDPIVACAAFIKREIEDIMSKGH